MNKPINIVDEEKIKVFWSKATLTANTDLCWGWVSGKDTDGYGRFKVFQTEYKAHRVSYFLFNKIDPGELLVAHKCDNTGCVNPYHLFLATNNDNIQDCINKGRNAKGNKNGSHTKPERRPKGICHGSKTKPDKTIRGEGCRHSKLKEGDIIEIRKLFKDGKTKSSLALKYNVGFSSIDKVVSGRSWKHI